MKEIRVMIVDDRDINRDVLKLLFKTANNVKIVAEASDGREALNKIKAKDIDVVIMDINMPNMNGIEATELLKKASPNIKILINSFHENPIYIRKIIAAGASGFIKKGESINTYLEAIESIYNNKYYPTGLLETNNMYFTSNSI